jgi:membrane-associated phospholipid phosphatase
VMRLDRGQYPWTMAVMSIALRIGEMVAMHYKNKFSRPRPSTLFPGLLVPFGPPLHPSFPSGHALQMTLMTNFLLRIPNVAARYGAELVWLANRIAKGRERAGLHYPSDTLCGFLLASVIDTAVQGTVPVPTLTTAMANAAAEW